MSLLLYWCTSWTLTKRMEKNLDRDYTNPTCSFEKVLVVIFLKTSAVQTFTTYPQNNPSKRVMICGTLTEKTDERMCDVLTRSTKYFSRLFSPPAAMHLLYRSNNFSKASWKSSCVSVSMTFVTASFISSIVS